METEFMHDQVIVDNRHGLAGVLISDAHNAIYIFIKRDGKVWNEGDRWQFTWKITNAHTYEVIGEWDDEGNGAFYSPAYGSETDHDMLETVKCMLSFMSAGAEAFMDDNYPNNENGTLFSHKVMETCYQFGDEIAVLACELDNPEGMDN